MTSGAAIDAAGELAGAGVTGSVIGAVDRAGLVAGALATAFLVAAAVLSVLARSWVPAEAATLGLGAIGIDSSLAMSFAVTLTGLGTG